MKLSRSSHAAFTLLEIMLVVMIIALLAGSAIYLMGGNIDIAKETKAKGDIQAMATQLMIYQSLNGFPPSTEQGLKALAVRPEGEPKPRSWRVFMKEIPVDPWGKDYVYLSPGKKNADGYDLYSAGKDRLPDTGDDIWGQ